MPLFEIPRKTGEVLNQTETPHTVEWRKVKSFLQDVDGKNAELSVAIAEDGKTRRVNFWDIDSCLLYTHDLFQQYLEKLFPNEDPEELAEVFRKGGQLGNSFREFHRMLLIYEDGLRQYEDAELYRETFITDDEKRKSVDGPGHSDGNHERAAVAVGRLETIAVEQMREIYENDPEYFTSKKFLNGPLVHLLEAKKRLGEVNVLMTANPRRLAETVIKYSGLTKYCYSLAGDEDMVGGGKEKAIEYLIGQLEESGIPVPKDRLVVIGDSQRGDVGSGWKLAQEKGYRFEGILVRKDQPEAEQFKKVLSSDPELQKMFEEMDITVVASADVPKGKYGYKLGKKGLKTQQFNE